MNEVARGRARRVGASLFVLLGMPLVAAAWSCGDDPVVDGVDGSPDGKGDAKDTGADAPPVTCPSGKEPKDDPTCVTNDLGIFVSAAGNDGDPGTKEKPVATLGAALTKAGSGGKGKIFVCEGSYTESVTISSTIGVYGGFKCADWSYSGTKPKIAGAKPDFVVKIDGASGVTIADLELDGKDGAPNSGESSVGVFANAADATLSRLLVIAGLGAKGPDGTLSTFTYPLPADLAGNDADAGGPGAEKIYSKCPGGGTSKGGAGGANGFAGSPGEPDAGGGKAGDSSGVCNIGVGSGGNGGGGAPGPNGAGGNPLGTLSATGWQASGGTVGGTGGVGQGGGGGGGAGGGHGGGGGAGGCGGAGGGSGKGGGGSIALMSLGATISLNSSELRSVNAGSGGLGVSGQTGQVQFGFSLDFAHVA